MVCDRCIKVVREELEKLSLDVRSIKLGEATVAARKGQPDIEAIRVVLRKNGFELIDDKRVRIVEKIKNAIITLIHHAGEQDTSKIKDSVYISQKVGKDYHYLSMLFSSMEGITIEKYIILQKIERVKELLKYDELTLSEIAYKMGYSSVAHLSNQFKKVTGLSASQYKLLQENDRKPIDLV
jgi:AraC family transcriptional regulator